jgi:nucleoside-diphosphate-sugar epimerase
MMKTMLSILGYGYVASAFANILPKSAYTIFGTSRDSSKRNQSAAANIQFIPFNAEAISNVLATSKVLLICIPPCKDSGRDIVLDIFKRDIVQHARNFEWIGYLSSTGVYGDHQGRWVTEDAICHAQDNIGKQRLAAEQAWLELYQQHHLPVHIFRLAGIYGPNRSSIDRIKAGKSSTIFKQDQVFSRTHIHDLVRVLAASLAAPTPGEIFNICDDCPAGMHEVDQYAADLLQKKLKIIPYDAASQSAMSAHFFASNKRISNAKIKKTFNIECTYPSYKQGLSAILQGLA